MPWISHAIAAVLAAHRFLHGTVLGHRDRPSIVTELCDGTGLQNRMNAAPQSNQPDRSRKS